MDRERETRPALPVRAPAASDSRGAPAPPAPGASPLRPEHVLELQRTAGNRLTVRALDRPGGR
jgi:hypothetical protein